ncbi:MAG: hypothetical protein Q7J47_03260 [Azoarcus sp.]|nr:hypothetical protein [Azoarcus sp.]
MKDNAAQIEQVINIGLETQAEVRVIEILLQALIPHLRFDTEAVLLDLVKALDRINDRMDDIDADPELQRVFRARFDEWVETVRASQHPAAPTPPSTDPAARP